MLSVDTNIVVRLLTEDDSDQTAVARELFDAGPVWIAKTVLLETEWVLRSGYGFEAGRIRDAFIRLLGYRNAHIEDKEAVAAALSLTVDGIDFADALHLTGSPPGIPFVTFDRTFIRRAKRAGVTRISEPADHLSR